MPKISKTVIESLKPGTSDVYLWDSQLPGFGVRMKPSGVRSYIVQYRNKHSRSRRLTIGIHGRITAEEARKEARQLFSKVAHGEDPADERRRFREIPTLADFSKRYFDEYAPHRKKPGTIETDRINWRLHIRPALGSLPVTAVTRSDITRLMQSMKDTPGAANRTIQLLSNMMNVAERWGLRDDNTNPCRHVDRYRECKRERFLTPIELARLGDALTKAEKDGTESPFAIAAIRLLVLTGCRRGEILTLRWDEVDLERGCLRLSDSKTGPRTVILNTPAVEILTNIPQSTENDYVIVGGQPGAFLVNLKKPWYRIRKAAGLEDVRLHDLRHSFASFAIGSGEGLPVISKLLGHAGMRTTERYAHLAEDPLRAANERIGAGIAEVLNGPGRKVVALKPPRGKKRRTQKRRNHV